MRFRYLFNKNIFLLYNNYKIYLRLKVISVNIDNFQYFNFRIIFKYQ